MLDVHAFIESFGLVFHWSTLAVSLFGLLWGLLVGALPGVGGAVGIAAILPFTFGLDPVPAIVLLTAIYTGGIAGHAIAAILINMPSTPGTVPTAVEGFALTRNGRALEALGISTAGSAVGTFISYALLLFALGPLAGILRFMGPADRAAIALAVITIVGGLRGKSLLRGLLAGALGLFLGSLGTAPNGTIRMQFLGLPQLYDGLPLIPTLVGLVSFSELVGFLRKKTVITESNRHFSSGVLGDYGQIVKHAFLALRYRAHLALGTVGGFFLGLLPGVGASISALFMYGIGQQWLNRKKTFGKGEPAAIALIESANNATEGGHMTVLLALGIPGSGPAALILSGFLMHNITPGPIWIVQDLPFAYAVAIANLGQAALFMLIAPLFMVAAAWVIYVPLSLLAPAIVIISTAGLYSLENSFFAVTVAWFFAYIGYVLKEHDFPPTAILLGFILAPSIDSSIYTTQRIYGDAWDQILFRPVVMVSIVFALLSILLAALRSRPAAAPAIHTHEAS